MNLEGKENLSNATPTCLQEPSLEAEWEQAQLNVQMGFQKKPKHSEKMGKLPPY